MKTLGLMRPFNTITRAEWKNLSHSLHAPLSGYLGGYRSSGYWIRRLESEWAAVFGTQHAIACNSATSGLLAACRAIGIRDGDEVWTTPYTMSATAAAAIFLGAKVKFIDIEDRYFCINMQNFKPPYPKAIIAVNLFGHPADLAALRAFCDTNGIWLIEDNAQAPLAREGARYTGTVGHVGVFSLNVHKHIQAGEGGVITTDNPEIAERLHGIVNHGECAGQVLGLNLRMTEPTAAIACAQLGKIDGIIEGRRELAHAISTIFADVSFVRVPTERADCRHVYYLWAGLVKNGRRKTFVDAIKYRGVPIRSGYSPLLTTIFGSSQSCPVAERVENEIITFEVCGHDPSPRQRSVMRDIILFEAERLCKSDH